MEDFSRFLSQTLDHIGYGSKIINIRRCFIRKHADVKNTRDFHNIGGHLINAGSKGEGLTSLCESDFDQLYLLNDAICTDNTEPILRLPDTTVIKTETQGAPAGYTRLKLVTFYGSVSRAFLEECVFESESNGIFLSSSLFVSDLKHCLQQQEQELQQQQVVNSLIDGISGPAIHRRRSEYRVDGDIVIAFNCHCPQILQSWASRPRYYNWPPAEVITEASSMFAQVVPVGSKGSCDQWREWRFCFIESELKLTFSLNHTQLKLYILMKMVAKEILVSESKEISSYIMKNITFWLSEILPRHVFAEENLFPLLVLSLKFLYFAVRQWNCLPYYMIPGRNLLKERLTPFSRRRLSALLKEIIKEGPSFLMKCSKLGTALAIRLTKPVLIIKYGEYRENVEKLLYLKIMLEMNGANRAYASLVRGKIFDIVLPEWKMLVNRGIPFELVTGVASERVQAILS